MRCLLYLSVSVSCICFVIGCQNIRQGSINDTNQTTFSLIDFSEANLLGEKFILKNVSRPVFLKVVPDKNLLIILEKDGENLGRVFTLDSLQYIKSFIDVGSEPEKQLIAFGIQYVKEEKRILISDPIKRQLFAYDVDSLEVPEIEKVLPSQIISFNNHEIIRPQMLVTDGMVDLHPGSTVDSIGVLQFFHQTGMFDRSFGEYPPHRTKYAPYELFSVFMSGINLSNNRDYVALNYYYSDYLDIYHYNGEIVHRLQGPGNNTPIFKRVNIRGGRAVLPDRKALRSYLGDAHMDEKLLVLYSGSSANESASHANRLFQFSRDFKPEISYLLETAILVFDIDWSKKTIYGLSDKHGDYRLIKYQLQW